MVSNNASYTFTVNAAGAYVANFEALTYNITATANPAEGGAVEGANTYTHGSSCTLTAKANNGYDFINWTKNGAVVSTNESYTFTVTESGEYVANFELQTFEVTVAADPAEGGEVTLEGDNHYGATVTVSVVPAENYVFLNWTKDNEEVSTETSYSFTLTENCNLVAHLFDISSVDENEYQTMTVYPNPVKDKLVIKANKNIDMVEVYNMTGAVVLKQACNSDNVEVDVTALQNGIYFVKMTTGNASESRSFIKE